MCFRKSFWNEIKEYWVPEIPHDCMLTFYAKLKETCYSLDYPVIKYRYHVGSASHAVQKSRTLRLESLMLDRLEIDNLESNFTSFTNDDWKKKALLDSKNGMDIGLNLLKTKIS